VSYSGTAAGTRTIALDDATAAGLRRWRKVQAEERLVMGAGWQGGHDLLATEPDGSPVYPQTITRRFQSLCRSAGVPVIRLHDVRHSYATAALASGVPVKVLSRRLGHADIAVTLRVYAHVLPGDDEAAALTAAAFIRG
jgi:integrase